MDPDTVREVRWIQFFKPNPAARIRVFCFHHAGGSATMFRTWGNALGTDFEVVPIELPGRMSRSTEPLMHHMSEVTPALASALLPFLAQKPYVLFGHSLGTVVAYELAQHLAQHQPDVPMPLALFVSGRRAPHMPMTRAPLHTLPLHEFAQEIHRTFGSLTGVIDDPDLVEMVCRPMQADFELVETYQHPSSHRLLTLPVHVFSGRSDGAVTEAGLRAWSELTTGEVTLDWFDGDHFYLTKTPQPMLDTLAARARARLDALQTASCVTGGTDVR